MVSDKHYYDQYRVSDDVLRPFKVIVMKNGIIAIAMSAVLGPLSSFRKKSTA